MASETIEFSTYEDPACLHEAFHTDEYPFTNWHRCDDCGLIWTYRYVANGPRNKLNPAITEALLEKICMLVKEGATPSVAAVSVGITAPTYYTWFANHEWFRDAVLEAQAEARTAVEILVRRTNPTLWLKAGPGRFKRMQGQDDTDWSEAPSKVEVQGQVQHAHLHAKVSDESDIDLSRLTTDELYQWKGLLEKAQRPKELVAHASAHASAHAEVLDAEFVEGESHGEG